MREEVLGAILAADKQLSRDEPEIASNIGHQLDHMGLETWSISVRRRIRDSIARLQPKRVLHTGAGIGHLSAWLFDYFSGVDTLEEFQLVEEGNRFAVILKRLCDRYSDVPSSIVVGMPSLLSSELTAWKITKSGNPPIMPEADVIIVDSQLEKLADDIQSLLPLLNKNGVLFTVEPTAPVGELDDDDPNLIGFNNWMSLIRKTNDTHHIAFAPLFGGTIVAWLLKD